MTTSHSGQFFSHSGLDPESGKLVEDGRQTRKIRRPAGRDPGNGGFRHRAGQYLALPLHGGGARRRCVRLRLHPRHDPHFAPRLPRRGHDRAPQPHQRPRRLRAPVAPPSLLEGRRLPDHPDPDADRQLLQRDRRLVGRVLRQILRDDLRENGTGGGQWPVCAVRLVRLAPRRDAPGLPDRLRGCRGRRGEVRHREVQQGIPAGPLRADYLHPGLFGRPAGGRRGRALPAAPRLERAHAAHLRVRDGAELLLAVARNGGHHHLRLVRQQTGKYPCHELRHGGLRPAVRHPGRLRHHAGGLRRRD